MKKAFAIATALCLVFSSASAFAKTEHDGAKKGTVHTKAHHKMHTKAHHGKMHTKATKAGHKFHIKATPGMPKTGMGGASN
ncbi:hypothetical protein ACTID9_17655 [Brevibacillus fluminis]|uniref:hypothetical protein n=1 Tax=Brevibacillus fluminis TaxID=511487 RepID=UPI003F898FFB